MVRSKGAFRAWGGNLARLINTLMMFRARYGCYPTELHVSPTVLSTLVCHHFTPYGFYLLQQKVKFIDPCAEEEFFLVAKDENGRTLNYSEDGWSHPTGIDDVEDLEEWLGFSFAPES